MGYVVTFRPEVAANYAGPQITVEADALRREGDLLVSTASHGLDYDQRSPGRRSVCVLPAADVADVQERELRLAELAPGQWGYVPC